MSVLDWLCKFIPPPARGVMQMPISDIPPPVPESMRHHYLPGKLDEEGYVRPSSRAQRNPVLDDLRRLSVALPIGARVSLGITARLTEDKRWEPIPPETTEVAVFAGGLWYSFYVEDAEWGQGTVPEEIAARIQRVTPKQRLPTGWGL